jgi:hypothetical protein
MRGFSLGLFVVRLALKRMRHFDIGTGAATGLADVIGSGSWFPNPTKMRFGRNGQPLHDFQRPLGEDEQGRLRRL